jgi:Bacterial membrane protein YfhO
MRLRRPVLFVLAALLAVQADVMFMGASPLQVTQPGMILSGPYGYDGYRPVGHVTIDPSGALNAELAWAAYFVSVIRAGSFPFWNPYQGFGQPQLANYVSGVLYPVNWLNLVLPRAWWDLVFYTDWFLVAWFTYLFVRVVRLDRDSAFVAACAVFATGFFAGFLGVRSIIGTMVWFPFLLYAIERSLREPGWRWKSPALAFGTYCLAVAGHPEPAFLGLALTMMYLGMRVLRVRALWREAVFGIVPACLFGGLLAAPLWVTFADYLFRDSANVHTLDTGLRHFPGVGAVLSVYPFLYGPLNFDIWAAMYSTLAWIPAAVTFLAVVGAIALVRRPRAALIAIVVIAALAGAKIYGVPIVNDIGRLPPFREFWFQYANGFLDIAVCVLAAAGFDALRREPAARWMWPLTAWAVLALVALAIGLYTMQKETAYLAAETSRIRFLLVAITAGVFWAAAYPVGLLLVRILRPDARGAFLLVAVGGLLLEAVACFPTGSVRAFKLFNAAAAVAFGVVVVAAVVLPRRAVSRSTVPAGLAVAAGAATVAACALISPRFAARYDIFTPAPFVAMLQQLPNAPRIYPLDGVLSPDFAAPFGITSVTNIENLTPRLSAAFFSRFLDTGAALARFYGLGAARTPGAPDALAEFWTRKRYWDLVGVRYLMTGGRDPNLRVLTEPPPGAAEPVPLAAPREVAVSCGAGPFDAVGVQLSTYAATQRGRVHLEVLDTNGNPIAQAAPVDSATLVDNADQSFALPAAVCAAPAPHVVLRLRFEASVPGAMIAAWTYPGRPDARFLYKALQGAPLHPGHLTPAFTDAHTGVQVWANPTAAERAFLAPRVEVVASPEAAMERIADSAVDLQRTAFVEQNVCRGDPAFPAGTPPGRLSGLKVGPNTVEIDYEARTSGVLMLSDAYTEGWRARVDGRDAPVLRVDGAFRGVCIDAAGAHRVEFAYRPARWTPALALAGMGAAGLLGHVVVTRRGRRRVMRPV